MDRRKFLTTFALIPIAGAAMKLNDLNKMTGAFDSTERMPVLFIGHGSPMNAIEDNEFSRGWAEVGSSISRPAAIVCISAHWETRGTYVTAMQKPPTIHDFGGFPKALFDVQYPAPGDPVLARETKAMIRKTEVGLDDKWGLDHGSWSVIKRLYPKADVPVIEMSLDYMQPAQYHYDLAKELSALRRKGVLIIGSGNMVHNLGMIAWDKMNVPDYGYDWAVEANEKMKRFILSGDHRSLINYKSQGQAFDLAIPTPDHFLPLLYALALKEGTDQISFFNDKATMGSLTMTSIKIS
jgi:4,5-DOPA dioxygenase extradiol